MEKPTASARTSLHSVESNQSQEEQMIKLANAQLWVNNQDEALEFYTKKIGWEVRVDATVPELGNFRWLTVGPPSQQDVSVVLMAIPGPPVMDAETAGQVRDLMSKGFAGTVFLTTDDCQASYEELKARGVEFTEAPEERPYGVDSGFRDPSGNNIRLTEVRDLPSA
jgi:predicted enzyme related to lactoylglutathione lyase